MNEDVRKPDHLLKERNRYTRLSVIFLFALAALQGLHSFFFTLFFWLAAGAGAMAGYFHIMLKRGTSPAHQQDYSRSNPSRGRPSPAQGTTTMLSGKRLVVIGFSVIVGFFALLMFIGLFFGEAEPSGDDQQTPSAEENYDLAYASYEEKNYREAINILRPGLMNGSSDSQAMVLLGDSYYEEKNLDSAYVWYNKAYGLGERSANLSHLMAYILDEKGQTIDAIKFYKEALSQDSARVDIYKRLGELDPENASRYLKMQKGYQ
jgi:tetratricopeptide (TPR) repeat protein